MNRALGGMEAYVEIGDICLYSFLRVLKPQIMRKRPLQYPISANIGGIRCSSLPKDPATLYFILVIHLIELLYR